MTVRCLSLPPSRCLCAERGFLFHPARLILFPQLPSRQGLVRVAFRVLFRHIVESLQDFRLFPVFARADVDRRGEVLLLRPAPQRHIADTAAQVLYLRGINPTLCFILHVANPFHGFSVPVTVTTLGV